MRQARDRRSGLDAFTQEYALSSEEGVVLMCLAEALLRVPDAPTADKLIADKIGPGHWDRHLNKSHSLFVNMSTFGLMLTGRVITLDEAAKWDFDGIWRKLVARSGEPVIRQAVTYAMRILGGQFVLGRTIEEALKRARPQVEAGYRFSFDMLGEAAYTEKDAARYLRFLSSRAGRASPKPIPDLDTERFRAAQHFGQAVGAASALRMDQARARDGRTVAPAGFAGARGARSQSRSDHRCRRGRTPRPHARCLREPWARATIWPAGTGWGWPSRPTAKRALPLIDWLGRSGAAAAPPHPRASGQGRLLGHRDQARARRWGLADYPVFTRKCGTDTSYLACARALLAAGEAIYPQFATHNAHTLSAVQVFAGERRDFEYQRLHGMGEMLYELYREVKPPHRVGAGTRIYAPVGTHEDLLAYLVRRLLENGANTSFVNRLADEKAPIESIIADPVEELAALTPRRNPHIPKAARPCCPTAGIPPASSGPIRPGRRSGADARWKRR